jgi:hypothetical protein
MPTPESAKADFPKFQPPVSTGGRMADGWRDHVPALAAGGWNPRLRGNNHGNPRKLRAAWAAESHVPQE